MSLIRNVDQKALLHFAIRAAARTWEHFRMEYPILNIPMPEVRLNNRFSSTAGMAYYETNHIELSTKLLIEFPRDFVVDTIPHEIAHIADYHLHGNWGHGPTWKQIMTRMGVTPNRTHQLCNHQQMRQMFFEAIRG